MNAYRIRMPGQPDPTLPVRLRRVELESLESPGSKPLASLQVDLELGADTPRYWFYVGQVAFRAEDLPLGRRDRVLLLGNDYTGARAIQAIQVGDPALPGVLEALLCGTLALLPPADSEPLHPLSARTIVELPGVTIDGRSPFWDGLGARFYRHLPARDTTDRFRAEAQIAMLLPRQPVVVSLLEASARDAIGVAAGSHAWLVDALKRCGFSRGFHVNPCDGGPVFEANPGILRTHAFQLESRGAASPGERWLVQIPGQDGAFALPARRTEGSLVVAPAHARLVELAAGAPCLASRLPA